MLDRPPRTSEVPSFGDIFVFRDQGTGAILRSWWYEAEGRWSRIESGEKKTVYGDAYVFRVSGKPPKPGWLKPESYARWAQRRAEEERRRTR